jgi:hypothetical protein
MAEKGSTEISADGDDPRPTPRREKQTLIPAFDPALLAMELELAKDRPTITPPYDPSSYARIVENHVGSGDGRDTPRTITAVTPVRSEEIDEIEGDAASVRENETIGRAMYGSYLSSDYPEALVLAERVLAQEPDHALARVVLDECRSRLGTTSDVPLLLPSSIVRLKRPAHEVAGLGLFDSDTASSDAHELLDHVDGLTDVAMLAQLAGIPRPQAVDRLHALLELGLLEVVNG